LPFFCIFHIISQFSSVFSISRVDCQKVLSRHFVNIEFLVQIS
jgi:hypothetical protein